MNRQNWIDHKFETGIDIGWTSNILCRIQDTAFLLEYHCRNLTDIQLSMSKNNTWSIKEHVGHLTDLEELWSKRFQEFPKGNKELIMADMSNKKTNTSNHNKESLETLLINFKTQRKKLLAVYNSLDVNAQNHQAMHPRIKKLMRPVDLLFFIAEHDNHHITSIAELKNKL